MTTPMNKFMTDEYVLAYHGPIALRGPSKLFSNDPCTLTLLCAKSRDDRVRMSSWCADGYAQILLAENWTEQTPYWALSATLLHSLQGLEADVGRSTRSAHVHRPAAPDWGIWRD